MSKVSNEQLKIMLEHDLARLRCRIDCDTYILEIQTNDQWHQLKSRRGHVREFKSYDAMLNHVSRLTSKEFNINFCGSDINV